MDLPEELLDEIFSHLPSYDEQSLRSCSLVSKSWLEPSRRLLFSNIRIHQDNYLSWLNNISPTNAGLLRNVRSLAYFFRVYDNPDPRCCVCALHDYFPSFHQLRALEFYKLDIEPTIPDHLTLFSTFQHTLFSLSLTHGLITWSSFVALVGYFPHLRDLTVRGPRFQVDDRPVPQILHPLRGRLVVDSYLPDESMKLFVNRFPELKQEYEELEITTSFEPRLLTAVEGSLKYLTLHRCEPGTAPDLSRFAELRQLEFATTYPKEDRMFISSITSTNLQKIVFGTHHSGPHWDTLLDDPCWVPFDDVICGLVDRLRMSGFTRTLEIELLVTFVEFGEEEFYKKFLPKFKEKGRVRIILALSRGVREWP